MGTEPEEKKDEDEEKLEECKAAEHHDKFDPQEYLQSFYKSALEDSAMNIVLFFLPGILYRLPEKIKSILDLGAGPTVYLPIALRNRAETIYTSDYAPANRETLINWIENKSSFEWDAVCNWIANIEASEDKPKVMEDKARSKMRAVFEVDVHNDPVIRSTAWKAEGVVEVPKTFQVVTTVFCMEYSCETLEGYYRAVRSACSLIEDGGFLVQGGVMGENYYSFGGKKFTCHNLHKSHIVEALKRNGMAVEEKDGYKFITHDDIFLLVSKKLK